MKAFGKVRFASPQGGPANEGSISVDRLGAIPWAIHSVLYGSHVGDVVEYHLARETLDEGRTNQRIRCTTSSIPTLQVSCLGELTEEMNRHRCHDKEKPRCP
jgi:hypothetical protein